MIHEPQSEAHLPLDTPLAPVALDLEHQGRQADLALQGEQPTLGIHGARSKAHQHPDTHLALVAPLGLEPELGRRSHQGVRLFLLLCPETIVELAKRAEIVTAARVSSIHCHHVQSTDVTATGTLTHHGRLSLINIATVGLMMVFYPYSDVAQIVPRTSPGLRGIWTGADIGIVMIAGEMIAYNLNDWRSADCTMGLGRCLWNHCP